MRYIIMIWSFFLVYIWFALSVKKVTCPATMNKIKECLSAENVSKG
jgi:hypothetical protein